MLYVESQPRGKQSLMFGRTNWTCDVIIVVWKEDGPVSRPRMLMEVCFRSVYRRKSLSVVEPMKRVITFVDGFYGMYIRNYDLM
jgi:hypothetical protein